jgi:glycosyltransferase involved in cell wall biosynthesis
MTAIVSVIIPAFNEEKLLATCIQRVRLACDSCNEIAQAYEIIVCNNNSSDQTAAIAQKLGCKVVFEPINQISRARNTGANAATGEWFLFIDADSWPSPELIADAVRILRASNYIGCGSTIQIVDGPWWFKRAWESKNLSMRLMKWCPGGFILCRRDAFIEIGGFPLDHFIFEEAEFVKRLKQLGRERRQKFTVLHKHPFTASGRKGVKYGFWSWAKTAVRFWLSPKKLVRDKSFAEKWYETGR